MMSKKVELGILCGDITQVHADAIVTGEGEWMDRESGVTKALISSFPQFRECRKRLEQSARRIQLPLWTAHETRMPPRCRYRYVIHAILDRGHKEQWVRHMRILYNNIVKLVDSLNDISTVAIPLLGTGTADTDREFAIRALLTSDVATSSKFILVIQDPNILQMVQRKSKEGIKLPNFLQRRLANVYDFVDFVDPNAYRDYSRPENTSWYSPPSTTQTQHVHNKRRPADTGNKTDDATASEKMQLQQALKLSKQEEKERKKKDHEDKMAVAQAHKPNKPMGRLRRQNSNREDKDLEHALQLSIEDAERNTNDKEIYEDEDGLGYSTGTNGASNIRHSETRNYRPQHESLNKGRTAREGLMELEGRQQEQYNDYHLQRGRNMSKEHAERHDKETDLTGNVAPDSGPSSYHTTGESDDEPDRSDDEMLSCPICLSTILEPKTLDKCCHTFCRRCIDRSFEDFKPVCPSCNMVYGVIKGNQPEGDMDVGFSDDRLPGHDRHGAITITFSFPSGIQGQEHPHPGRPYKGTTRRAYLPDSREGKEILRMLRTSFDRKLTFTIGRSTTTGKDDVVTFNDIHLKTRREGGPTRFGYPDPTYLERVKEELRSKGMTG